MGVDESLAMWQLFGSRNDRSITSPAGVAIALEDTDLQNVLPSDGTLKPVRYVNHHRPIADVSNDPVDWPFLKLQAFAHESEVRVVFSQASSQIEFQPMANWACVPTCNVHALVRHIRVLHPQVSTMKWMREDAARRLLTRP